MKKGEKWGKKLIKRGEREGKNGKSGKKF